MEDEVERDNYVYPGNRFTKLGYGIGAGQGMSLRDYFAGQVLAGGGPSSPDIMAVFAYSMADAMLKARKAPTDKE
jgi:hypothetical protein